MVSGVEVMKIQPFRFLLQSRTVQTSPSFGVSRHHAKRLAGFVQAAEDTGALGRGVGGQGMRVLGSDDASVDLFGMCHPVGELVHGRLVCGEQIGEDRPRVRQKKLLSSRLVREQTDGDWRGFGFVVALFSDRPIGASIVLGIKDPVAAIFPEELANVLAIWIEDDGDFVARGDLVHDLPNERRLAGAGVAGDLYVMRFAIAVDDQILCLFAQEATR